MIKTGQSNPRGTKKFFHLVGRQQPEHIGTQIAENDSGNNRILPHSFAAPNMHADDHAERGDRQQRNRQTPPSLLIKTDEIGQGIGDKSNRHQRNDQSCNLHRK